MRLLYFAAVFKLVGDEVRAREEVQKHIARDHALIKRQAGRVLAEIHRQLAAADLGAELLDVQHAEWVERFNAERSFIGIHPLTDGL